MKQAEHFIINKIFYNFLFFKLIYLIKNHGKNDSTFLFHFKLSFILFIVIFPKRIELQ